jgi:hypothetical protein
MWSPPSTPLVPTDMEQRAFNLPYKGQNNLMRSPLSTPWRRAHSIGPFPTPLTSPVHPLSTPWRRTHSIGPFPTPLTSPSPVHSFCPTRYRMIQYGLCPHRFMLASRVCWSHVAELQHQQYTEP